MIQDLYTSICFVETCIESVRKLYGHIVYYHAYYILFNGKNENCWQKIMLLTITTLYTTFKIFKIPCVFPTRDTIREQPTADVYPWIAHVSPKLRRLSLRLGLFIWVLEIWLLPRISLLRWLRGVFHSLHRHIMSSLLHLRPYPFSPLTLVDSIPNCQQNCWRRHLIIIIFMVYCLYGYLLIPAVGQCNRNTINIIKRHKGISIHLYTYKYMV